MSAQTYRVDGMTCGHCVAAVTREVQAIPGVTRVEVVLADGSLTVDGTDVDVDAVRAAVDEAGYTLV